jgi:pimeloyl-ACP methyl ester carboxylesterase
MGKKVDEVLAVLNGLVGDYLARTDNGLATEMGCYLGGERVELSRAGIARAYPHATRKVALLVHGVMSTEALWRFPDGSDYGSKLAADLDFTPFYVRYNSGLPIADNGASLAALLETLVDAYPVELEQVVLIGYSMGGLVVRSACHLASEVGQKWLARVQTAIYVGTPHLGAPAERAGRIVAKVLKTIPEPVTQLIGDISDLRSAGVKDLGDADLRHEDRARAAERLSLRDPKHPVALLPQIRHHLIAGSLALDPHIAALFGDSIVPLTSSTGARVRGDAVGVSLEIPADRVKVLQGRNHIDLAHDAEVYAQIRDWLGALVQVGVTSLELA